MREGLDLVGSKAYQPFETDLYEHCHMLAQLSFSA